MPIDQLDYFSNAQAITGDVISDNVISIGSAYARPGTGPRPLYIVVQTTTAFTDTGNNSTATVTFQTDTAANMSVSNTNTTIGTIATNSAVGDRIVALLPPIPGDKAFMGLYYTVAGGNFSTGAVSAWITPDPDLWSAKPAGWTGPSTS
jgi:hypothetical protein